MQCVKVKLRVTLFSLHKQRCRLSKTPLLAHFIITIAMQHEPSPSVQFQSNIIVDSDVLKNLLELSNKHIELVLYQVHVA